MDATEQQIEAVAEIIAEFPGGGFFQCTEDLIGVEKQSGAFMRLIAFREKCRGWELRHDLAGTRFQPVIHGFHL